MFELSFPNEKIAREALTSAQPQAPDEVPDRQPRGGVMAAGTKANRASSCYSTTSCSPSCARRKAELFNLRFQAATGQLGSHGRLRARPQGHRA